MSGHCNREVVTSSHATCPLFLLLQLVTSKDFFQSYSSSSFCAFLCNSYSHFPCVTVNLVLVLNYDCVNCCLYVVDESNKVNLGDTMVGENIRIVILIVHCNV